ncbi:transcriptional regulator, LacI family [Caloramator quimbayensis]|uniref:Transcriptional regulator, LacI family n=1 Tax=Caloramator quimbayensis TaxID=1147123 RepID=A0A1T4WJQ1_9CLOT|nr:LacI family DNA-binding transcriptional regulator [Caloramator quimbayensis]SKA77552.1 transcriptional regulator, LacI family [Caloramator quimbayensis]
MTTIYDISKATGFSPTTVSKALNDYSDVSEKTKQIILKKASEMGYIPNSHARILITKKSWTIGILFDEKLNIGMKHPYFNAIIESFKENVESRGYDLLFISKDLGGNRTTYLDHCIIRGIDGVIIITSHPNNEQIIELINSDFPCVLIDNECNRKSSIHSDDVRGCYLAVEYLYSLGHRKIAHIYGSKDTFAGNVRLNEFINSLKKFNLPKIDEYLVDGGYFSFDGGYNAMKKLLELEDLPTAVFTAGDFMAVGAISAIKEKGLRVPEDISIIGYDDLDICKYVTPRLTTIKQNTDLIGKNAADILINEIDKKICRTSMIIPVELVVRDSCKPIK